MGSFFELSKGRLHFHKMGQGAKLMVALHGFAQSAAHFKVLEEYLADHFTIYALDLPFHGQTEWHHSSYEPQDVLAWVDLVLQQEQQKTCYLLGHSLGGRIWLSCLVQLLPKVKDVFLLAPDGLATKGMLLPDAIPTWGRKGLAKTIHKPNWLLKLAYGLHRHHLLSPFAHQYLQYHFRSDNRQKRVLSTWISLGKFRIRMSHINNALNTKKETKIFTFLGKDDPLIVSDRVQEIVDALPQMELTLLAGGHQMINKNVAMEIKKRLTTMS